MLFQSPSKSAVEKFSQFVPDTFRKVRSPRFLEELFEACASMERWLEEQTRLFRGHRQTKFELFHHSLRYPFGKKRVLGVLVIINAMDNYELFSEHHLYSAICSAYPKARKVERSCLNFALATSPFHFIYLEINSPPGEEDEIGILLRGHLAHHAKERIQRLIPAPFARPNQEELFRKLTMLNAEFSQSQDLPQVVISYEEHDWEIVEFSVIHVRAALASATPLRELFARNDPLVTFIPIQSGITGKLDNDSYKQGDIYHLKLKVHPFLRNDLAIDVYRVRHYISTLLEKVIGPFRDFNGGLLQKQFEVLGELKASLQEKGESETFLLENFFFSISPISSQGTIPAHPLKELYLLLIEGKKEAQKGRLHQHFRKEEKEYHLELVLAGEMDLQQELERAIENLELQGGLSAITRLKLDGTLYLGWISLSYVDEERKKFAKVAERAFYNLTEQRNRRKQLRIGIRSPNPCLDPRLTSGDDSSLVVKHLYEGLTQIGKTGKLKLALAESIAVSTDGLIYTFYLRKAFWSNGDRITAWDFEQSWKQALQPHIDSAHNYLFYCIKNAQKAQQKQLSFDAVGIIAIDGQTLQVTLEHPEPMFTEMTAHWAYFPTYRQADGEDPAWADGTNLVVNGPFVLQDRRRDKEMVLVKNESYWDAKNICLEQILLYPVESFDQELTLFRMGGLDIVTRIDPLILCNYPWLKEDSPNYQIVQSDHFLSVYAIYINTQAFPLHHRDFRLALAAAINRQSILDHLGLDSASRAHSLIPSPLSQILPPSYGDAKEYLERACDDLGLTRLPVIEFHCGSFPQRRKIAEIIQQQWREVLGLETRLVELSWDDQFSRLWRGNFQITGAAWQSWFSDRYWIIQGMACPPASAANISRWEHGPFNEVMEQAARELNLHKRDAYLKVAEQILVDEAPFIPLFSFRNGHAKQTTLTGVQQGRVIELEFRWCTFDN